ncbi:MAG TPA: preprotein translocase subunit YajC [Dehalococcoidia bacterium]|nr:preprotein translocase subunit YajC [Dehalococcoidia bacterium]
MSILILAIAYPAAIAVLFYLAFLRPVQQHQKRQRQELASLRVGDEVLTQGGLIAVIKDIRVPEEEGPTELILDLGGLEVRAMASAILQRLRPAPSVTPAPAKRSTTRTVPNA